VKTICSNSVGVAPDQRGCDIFGRRHVCDLLVWPLFLPCDGREVRFDLIVKAAQSVLQDPTSAIAGMRFELPSSAILP
jgi:hypothetical protein